MIHFKTIFEGNEENIPALSKIRAVVGNQKSDKLHEYDISRYSKDF